MKRYGLLDKLTRIVFAQISTPATPSSGYTSLYFKSDDKLYKKTSAGTESEIGGTTSVVVPGTSNGLVSLNGLTGNTSGSAISAGYVGEILTHEPGDTQFTSSDTAKNFATLSLTAGVWDVQFSVELDPSASTTLTTAYYWMNTVSAGSVQSKQKGGIIQPANKNRRNLLTGVWRVNVSSTTSVYANGQASYTGTAPTFSSMHFSARRIA